MAYTTMHAIYDHTGHICLWPYKIYGHIRPYRPYMYMAICTGPYMWPYMAIHCHIMTYMFTYVTIYIYTNIFTYMILHVWTDNMKNQGKTTHTYIYI